MVVALPNCWIPSIEWGGELLKNAMFRHHMFYDYPAHYLRVSALFETAFWRDQIRESYFMLDAFSGCCVYDEGSRNSTGGFGVLSWLLAGEPALSMSNQDDSRLIGTVLESLPKSLRHGRSQLIEGRVHRWVGTVDGLPGGFPARDPEPCHQPEPDQHPQLFVVGDYMFDSTINGVLDSADIVSEWISGDLEPERGGYALTNGTQASSSEPLPQSPAATLEVHEP